MAAASGHSPDINMGRESARPIGLFAMLSYCRHGFFGFRRSVSRPQFTYQPEE